MSVSDADLRQLALDVTAKAQQASATRPGWRFMGYVGAALETVDGNVHTGVVVNLEAGIGFCAEHAAIAEMIKNGESRIARIAARTAGGATLPPCGRCREMMAQVDVGNLDTTVLMPDDESTTLRELLPHTWQPYWDG
jgi:cytidine deaminase